MCDEICRSLRSAGENVTDEWGALLARQTGVLPVRLRQIDRNVLKATEWSLVVVGSLFTAMISLEVASRYAFGFSTFFVSAAAKFLLLWFFMLGAGLALRVGAHVGFELILRSTKGRARRFIKIAIQILALTFFAQMIWSGLTALGPATGQIDSALHVSLLWGFLAIPVGFGLLVYHTLILIFTDRVPDPAEGGVV